MSARLVLLSLAAGCIDAVAFVHAGAFPANMTGNSVLMAISVSRLDLHGITLAGLALLGFIAGAAAGARLVRGPGHSWSPRVNAALLLTGGILLAVPLGLVVAGLHLLPPALFLVAAAMGLQSAAIQHLAVPGVATVFVTGTLTTAVVRLASPDPARPAPPPDSGKWLPALSWAAYLLGALLGAAGTLSPYQCLLVAPGLLILGIAVANRPRPVSPRR